MRKRFRKNEGKGIRVQKKKKECTIRKSLKAQKRNHKDTIGKRFKVHETSNLDTIREIIRYERKEVPKKTIRHKRKEAALKYRQLLFCRIKLEEYGERMKQRRNTKIKAILLILLVVILCVLLADKMKNDFQKEEYSTKYIALSEVKAELAFSVYTPEEWEDYFAVYHKEYLTWEMAAQLLEKLGVSEQIPLEKRNCQAVKREEWTLIYEQILDYLDMEKKVAQKEVLLLDTETAKDGVILITSGGDYFTELPEQWFTQWQAYGIYTMEEMCIGVKGISEEETQLSNAYLKENAEGKLTFLYSGGIYEKEVGKIDTDFSLGVCDIVFSRGNVTALRMKQDGIEGALLSYDEQTIEIRDYGKIAHQGKLPVYQTYGEIQEKSISDIVLGNMNVEYITAGTEVCAILIREPAEINDIRVLLLGEDGSNFRSDIYLKCNTPSRIKCGDIQEDIAAGTQIHVTDYLVNQEGKTFTLTPGEGGTVVVCEPSGTAVSNPYSGSMEARSYEQGYTLVNQLPFEQYLYAVVPSEMPVSFGAEALKAQAVCARSYAYIQLLRADLAEYGAHINDSTSYQVYNKVAQTVESVEAVEATRGKVLKYQGNVVEAYYFSTSMGYTDTAEIWNIDDTANYGYLHKFCLNQSEYDGNLSDETEFLDYIKSDAEGFDSDIKYYRWFATADFTGKAGEINEILKNRRSVSEKNVIYYGSDGVTETDSTAKLGEITGISVEERSASGSILTLKLQYEKGAVRVKTEYNIRKVLGALVKKMVYKDGSESENISMLPSAFCAVTAQEDGSLTLSGGGYGHGLGMSQNGANGMAQAGMSCEDILHAFYQDVEIEDVNE